MGLTPFDVQNLNNAIAGIGQSAVERRKEAMQQQHLDTEEDMRQQMLDVEQRRMQAEQDRAKALQTGQALRDKQAMLQSVIQLNAGGQLSDDALDDVNDYLANDEHFGQTGIQLQKPPQKPDPNLGQNTLAQALQVAQQFEAKGDTKSATLLRNWATSYGKPQPTELQRNLDAADAMDDQANKLESSAPEADPLVDAQVARMRQNAKALRAPKYDPSQFQTVTTAPDPLNPGGPPKVTTQTRVPVGAAPAQGAYKLMKNPAGQVVRVPAGTVAPAGYTPAQ